MAETPEIDTNGLRETIDREIERESSGLLRRIALSTALLAALAAIAALTRRRLVWIGSMALGAIGCGFLALALLAR